MKARERTAASTNVTLARCLEKFVQVPELTANAEYQAGQEKGFPSVCGLFRHCHQRNWVRTYEVRTNYRKV